MLNFLLLTLFWRIQQINSIKELRPDPTQKPNSYKESKVWKEQEKALLPMLSKKKLSGSVEVVKDVYP